MTTNDTTYRSTGGIGCNNGITSSYSNGCHGTSIFASRITRSTTYGQEFYSYPTEDKTKTEKGGN